jgi:UDP-2-acetamido-3-amino-2,3-dideoxy-glucuronate N-acetyltransferase
MKQNGADSPRIHPTAIVEDEVVLGPRTAVWDNVHMRGPSTIGRDCIIGEKTYIAYGVSVGDYVKINAHVYVCTGVTIEDRVFLAAGVIFTNDRNPRAFADGYEGLAPSEPNDDTLRSWVRTGATIGAGAIIGPGLEIGRYAMVGMGSVVVSDVPPHGLVYGTPARLRGWVCMCGTPLRDVGPHDRHLAEACTRCGRRYALTDAAAGLALTRCD